MSEKFLYQFDNFTVDPSKQLVFKDDKPIALTAKPFQLLLTLIEGEGESIRKEDLINRVWPGMTVTDTNFHVNLDKVRKALGESGREPYYILRTSIGYRFSGVLRKTSVTLESTPASSLQRAGPVNSTVTFPWVHLVVSSALYAGLYAESLLLEVAYQWAELGVIGRNWIVPTFVWIFGTSMVGLVLSWKRTGQAKRYGLLLAICVFVSAAFLLYVLLIFVLPDYAVTQATFQTRAAHAAYLKNISYFLPLALLYIVIPVHFVGVAQQQLFPKNCQSLFELLSGRREAISPIGSIYIPPRVLGLLLGCAGGTSLLLTNHLLDNLRPGEFKNFFTHLVMWRVLLYFSLGLECLLWYYRSLNRIKRDCRFLLDS